MSPVLSKDQRVDAVKSLINSVPDFPKPGILFRDIFPVFRDPTVLGYLIDLMVEQIQGTERCVDAIVALDARGFLLGPMISLRLNCAFVPIRKRGKLPGNCVQASYQLEYGSDVFEAQEGSLKKDQKVVIVDDLLATGGSMSAAIQLVTGMGAQISECVTVIELQDLNGRQKLMNTNFFSFIQY